LFKKFILIAASISILAACTPTPRGLTQAPDFATLKPLSVRAGLTAQQVQNLTVPRDGLRVQYDMPMDESFPFPTRLDIQLFRADVGFAGLGNLRVELPIEDLGDIIQGLEQVTGRSPELDGRYALVPIEIGFDEQMRSTSSTILSRSYQEKPHDCFMVIGDCKSAKFDSVEGWNHVIYSTYEEGGRFYSIERNDPARSRNNDIVAAAVYSVDKYGMILDLSSINYLEEDASVSLLRRLQN
jgi:hypothetical protein